MPSRSSLLKRGKHVLVEKPITETVAQAEELVAEAKRQGLIFQVGHLERFNPAVEAVENMISDPKFIEVQRLGSFSARSLDVDVVLDLMIHDLDIILALIKDEVGVIRSSGHPRPVRKDRHRQRPAGVQVGLRRHPDRQPCPPGQGPEAPDLRADLLLLDRLHRPGSQGFPPQRPPDGHQDLQDPQGRAAQEGDPELPDLHRRAADRQGHAARRACGLCAWPTTSSRRSRRPRPSKNSGRRSGRGRRPQCRYLDACPFGRRGGDHPGRVSPLRLDALKGGEAVRLAERKA